MIKFNKESLVHRVILKPLIQKETKSGIIIQRDTRSAAVNTDRGEIVMFGNQAWKDWGCETPPVKPGDTVYYARYGAKVIKPDDESDDFYVLCNDEDILVGYTQDE